MLCKSKNCKKAVSPRKRCDALYCSTSCRDRERMARWRENNLAKARGNWLRWSQTLGGTATVLLAYARRRAKKFNLPFEIDRNFILVKLKPMLCEMTGIPLDRRSSQKGRASPFAPSLDRRNRLKGYTKQNTRIVCFAVNCLRYTWSDVTLRKIARGLLKP